MRCPNCDAEVTEQSVFCHKCGERILVTPGNSGPAAEVTEGEPIAPRCTPIERFGQAVAGARANGDEGETELWQGGYSPKAMVGAWIASGLITLALLTLAIWLGQGMYWLILVGVLGVLWIYQLGVLAVRRLGIRYTLTNQRLIHESGILRRITDRIEVIDIDDVTLEQGIVERMFATGSVRVSSSDRTHPELILEGIDGAKQVADTIDDVRRSERRRRGLHIEQV